MPSRRDYADEYRRRQERAREAGFASDYDRRMRRGVPEGPLPYSEEAAEYQRGHRGEGFLRDYAREGDAVQIGSERDSQGRFTTLNLYPEDPDREVRTISIRDLSTDDLRDLLDDLAAEGVAVTAGYLEE
jgi:hypothetical protein